MAARWPIRQEFARRVVVADFVALLADIGGADDGEEFGGVLIRSGGA